MMLSSFISGEEKERRVISGEEEFDSSNGLRGAPVKLTREGSVRKKF